MTRTSPRLLVVGGEEVLRESLAGSLLHDGISVERPPDLPTALERLREQEFAVALLDLQAPGTEGFLEEARKLRPDCAVVVATEHARVGAAVSAMKRGAWDYLLTPLDPEELSLRIRRIIVEQQLAHDNAVLRKALEHRYDFHDVVSKSPAMQKVFELARVAARSSSPALIVGERGAGKEVLARAIHEEGPRRATAFVAVSCAGLTQMLPAQGGTLFLDEIADLSPRLQIELLRLLEERKVHGADKGPGADARILAATRRDLAKAAAEGAFRQDLFDRLDVVALRLPPLRERKEDIPLLVEKFLETIAAASGRALQGVSQQALGALMAQKWPGNISELREVIERGAAVAQGPVLQLADVGLEAGGATRASGEPLSLQELEKRHIVEVLSFARNNVTHSARILGIDRVTLYNKIKRYRLAHR